MRPLAQKLIEDQYIKRGNTVRILVIPAIGSNLPEYLIEKGEPVGLDLLSNRPINLKMNENGIEADLCFNGPPVTCLISWSHILGVISHETLIVTAKLLYQPIMENENLPKEIQKEAPKDSKSGRSHLRRIK